MKKLKKLILALTITLSPINIFAYSDYIIPGGESIGIELKSDGVMVVGFYKINGKFNKGTPFIKVGDKILKVDDKEITTTKELVDALETDVKKTHKLILSRDGKIRESVIELEKEGNTYKTGLYVKDEITGLGTLTYIDPGTNIYGSLGHNIEESNTNKTFDVKSGSIFKSEITGIDRSTTGTPGGKIAKFDSTITLGTVEKNITTGIFGKYNSNHPEKELKKVVDLKEAKLGPAEIFTVLNDTEVESYNIEITKIDFDNKIKNIYFQVTDERLLEKTGGIVQGMSGSPIIQGDNIIGAVTHVVVSNPKIGYGISIKTMLQDGEK